MLQKSLFCLSICICCLYAITACSASPYDALTGGTSPAPAESSSCFTSAAASQEEENLLLFSKGEWFLSDLGVRLYEISFWKDIESPTDRSSGFISYYLDKNPDAPYVERDGARYYDSTLVETFLLERFELGPQDLKTCSVDSDPFRAPDPEAPEPAYVPTLPPTVVSVEQTDDLLTVWYEIYSEKRLISCNKLVIRILSDDSFRYISNEVRWKIPRNA